MRSSPLRSVVIFVFCLAMIPGITPARAQVSRTWIGPLDADWFNPTNWFPTGIPATNDIINFTDGNINLSAPVTIYNQFNWSAGILSGASLTIASNAVMNISAITTLFLECPLTNAGTVILSNTGSLDVPNGFGYTGLIENLPGALWDLQSDQNLFNNNVGPAYFYNAGTLRKSATSSGTSYIYLPIINSGSVTNLQGNLSFQNGGVLSGTFAASAGTAIQFAAGNFTNSGPVAMSGPGSIQFAGDSLTLLADIIANLPLTAGTVVLGPGFQGGTITNLTIDGATLSGTNTVTGVFNWNNGVIAGPITIASNALLNISATTTLYLENPLTNAGTVVWSNTGNLDVPNGYGYTGLIENLPGSLWDIQNDQSIFNNNLGPAYFHNAGTLRKSATSSGTTSFYLPILNSGDITDLQGTISFEGGGILAGGFTAGAGTSIQFSGGNFTNAGPVSLEGPGPIALTGASLFLLNDIITNLPLTLGTVYLGPAFQGGTITNFTIAGATLAGTNTVTGIFNWDNGMISGPLTVASNGLMNINGSTTLYLLSPLTNAGMVVWSNTGNLDVLNGGGYNALIQNLPGALWDIQSDQSIFNNSIGQAYFYNAGTLEKSASSSGSSIFSLPVTNSGSVLALEGNLEFNNGFVPAGGTILFGLSGPSAYGTIDISGNATLGGTVGVLWLNGFVPASGNSFTNLTYNSYTGIFTNVNLPTGAVWLTNYGPNFFTISVGSINQLGFVTQPLGGVLPNTVLAPVVIQAEDPSNNPVAVSGVGVTLSLNSGSGTLNGTLTQNTDASGKATFNDLSLTTIGTKTLAAASAKLTPTISLPFQIIPLIGEQWSSNGLVLQLNGTNNPGPVTIYASTNLKSWFPLYTNAGTNGPIVFLDFDATNYPIRFYRFSTP